MRPGPPTLTRRTLLAAGAALGTALAGPFEPALPQHAIPRWRGFNLLDFFQAFQPSPPVTTTDDLRWIRDWGFNFVRIPLDYWLWVDSPWRTLGKLNPYHVKRIDEAAFGKIDRLMEQANQFGLHVNLCFHRAPGYCIADDREPFLLWRDAPAEEAFLFHWDLFARRYRAVSNYDLSFNLINEAPVPKEGYMSREDYIRIMKRAIAVIRRTSPSRLIFIDGLDVGNTVVDELALPETAQSVHAYWPPQVSHYRASWVDKDSSFALPTWPVLNDNGTVKMGRQQLEEMFAPWIALAKRGTGVNCGECGAYNRTPHGVFLAWMEDVMQILTKSGIGSGLWNFHGPFGLLDSGRTDVAYENWHGAQLDRKLLNLLQNY